MVKEFEKNIVQEEFELHIATEFDGDNSDLAATLSKIGFRNDNLMAQGVVFSPNDRNGKVSCPIVDLHVTWDTFKGEEYKEKRDEVKMILTEAFKHCRGYAHGEVIRPEWDLRAEYSPFDKSVPFPLKPFDSDAENGAKEWDIHIAADLDSFDAELQKVLHDKAQMYFIDLKKDDGRLKRVFTIQGSNPMKEGLEIFEALKDYIGMAGGMAGSLKFEKTCFWLQSDKADIVPPTICSFEYE